MTHVVLFQFGQHYSDALRFFVSIDRDITVYADAMYSGIYTAEHIMSMSEAESRGLARRHYAPEAYARGIFRRCRRALRRTNNTPTVVDERCDMWSASLAEESFGPDERTLQDLAETIDDFMTEYTTNSLRALAHEGCCFDYLVAMLASEERRFPRLARVIDDTFRILERAVAWETRDRVADATLTTKLRRGGLPLRCAAGWVCDASGATGLEDADGDPCA